MYTIKNPETAIIKFRNEYLFLSNFYEGKIFTYKGCKFTNTEAAFHSQKDPKRIKEFQMLRPSQSKKFTFFTSIHKYKPPIIIDFLNHL